MRSLLPSALPLLSLLVQPLLVACGTDDSSETAPTQQAEAQPSTIFSSPASTSTGAAAEPRTGPALLPAQSSRSGGWAHYGTSFNVDASATMDCAQLLADPASHVDQAVRVKGRIADVCQAKGCWMVMTPIDGAALSGQGAAPMIRVTMKDHAFSVDKQGTGRETEVEGMLVAKQADAETVAHYEGEAGDASAIPEKQGMDYELVASTVRIRNP